ncbi:hypothetical protein ACDQ55_19385 [Chitinophaga sp. 30R24]|uniref:hypothetical protein n=1 Tax=Chitinophaga sp. 30R24 TaxID=3248838 RepID=UPI003B8F7B7A
MHKDLLRHHCHPDQRYRLMFHIRQFRLVHRYLLVHRGHQGIITIIIRNGIITGITIITTDMAMLSFQDLNTLAIMPLFK